MQNGDSKKARSLSPKSIELERLQRLREAYQQDSLLLEQDGHLLEEQRYLNRLRHFEDIYQKNIRQFVNKVALPELDKKQQMIELEMKRERERERIQELQYRNKEMVRNELSLLNAHALKQQIEQNKSRKFTRGLPGYPYWPRHQYNIILIS